jgi:hypothetical protein
VLIGIEWVCRRNAEKRRKKERREKEKRRRKRRRRRRGTRSGRIGAGEERGRETPFPIGNFE